MICMQPAFIQLRVLLHDRVLSMNSRIIDDLVSKIDVPDGCDLRAALGAPDFGNDTVTD
jgi:hypothetical protein